MESPDGKQRCEICVMFDCGSKCKCKCHYGSTPKIRTDHGIEGLTRKQRLKKMQEDFEKTKTEEAAMEGLSSLFG